MQNKVHFFSTAISSGTLGWFAGELIIWNYFLYNLNKITTIVISNGILRNIYQLAIKTNSSFLICHAKHDIQLETNKKIHHKNVFYIPR